MFKNRANIILTIAFISFMMSLILKVLFPSSWIIQLLFYMSEASLVGGLADWYAVTALFRHPLGIKTSHTAIIFKHRQKLIHGIVHMVTTELLPAHMLKQKVSDISFMKLLTTWMEQKNVSTIMTPFAWKMLHTSIINLNVDKFTSHLATLLEQLPSSKFFHTLFSNFVQYAEKQLHQPRTRLFIRNILEQEKKRRLQSPNKFGVWLKRITLTFAENVDAINLDDATDSIMQQLEQFLNSLHHENHPLRQQMINHITTFVNRHENVSPTIRFVIDSIQHHYKQHYSPSMVPDWFEQLVQHLLSIIWQHVRNDSSTHQAIDNYIRTFLTTFIAEEHRIIGHITADTLQSFTLDKLVSFIQQKVGQDLIRIRINGSLVGATIGGLLYVLLHFIYD